MTTIGNSTNLLAARSQHAVKSIIAFAACMLMLAVAANVRAADPTKVIRHVFPVAETGFDPAGVQDLYSATVEQMLFETLLTYDYLARPAKLIPLTAEAMPE